MTLYYAVVITCHVIAPYKLYYYHYFIIIIIILKNYASFVTSLCCYCLLLSSYRKLSSVRLLH